MIEFDDGDSGRIAIEDIRFLTSDYPVVGKISKIDLYIYSVHFNLEKVELSLVLDSVDIHTLFQDYFGSTEFSIYNIEMKKKMPTQHEKYIF